MQKQVTAVIERDADMYVAHCPEIPGANGEGSTVEEATLSLKESIRLILEDRGDDGLSGSPILV